MSRAAKLLLASSLFLGGSLRAADRAVAPDPIQLLDSAYAGPAFSYQGRVMLTQWTGKQTTAEEVNVFYSPPGRYRLEFLTPDGKVDRVVLGDGHREQVQLMKDGKVVSSYATEVSARFIDKEEERRLLLANYHVTLVGPENVMGRSTWVVDLTPTMEGKPSQRMWIDRDSKAVLEVKRSLPTGGASTQFTRFEAKVLPESLFGQDTSIVAEDIGKSVESPEEARTLSGKSGDQASLAGGFSLMGADLFDVKGETVRHLRYTDGLIPVSLFVTRVAVAAPTAPEDASRSVTSPIYFGLSTPVNVSQWKEGKEHYTLIGEVDPALLHRISAGTAPTN